MAEATKTIETVETERGIVNTQGYYIYFCDFELKEFVLTIPACVKNGPVYVHMSPTFIAAKKIHKKKENEEQDPHGGEKAPMDPDDYKSLSEAWKKHYGFNLHPTQEYTSQLMNGMFRMFRNRVRGGAKPVNGLYTLEDMKKVSPDH